MHEPTVEERFERFARTGDAADFGAVFDALAPDLLAVAKRLSRDRGAAEDLTQATWLAAIEAARKFEAERALKPWLVGILVRQAFSKRRERRASGVDALEHAAAAERDEVEERDTLAIVEKTLARLSNEDREVLEPLLFSDKRAVEIARELAKRPDTVHMRVHRGLARLRRLLATSFGIAFVVSLLERRALSAMKVRLIEMTCKTSLAAPVASSVAVGAFVLSAKSIAVAACVALAALALTWTTPWSHGLNVDLVARATPSELAKDSPNVAAMRAANSANASARAVVPLAPNGLATNDSPKKWIVELSIGGLADNESQGAKLTVVPISEKFPSHAKSSTLTFDVGATSTIAVDVTSLFCVDDAHVPRSLEVAFDHPRYLVAKTQVLTEREQLIQLPDGTSAWELNGVLTISVAAILRGRVDAPWSSTTHLPTVAAYAMKPLGPSGFSADVLTPKLGEDFRVRLPSSDDYAVVEILDGALLHTWIATAKVGEERVLDSFVLEPGATIDGVVEFGGDLQADAMVRVRPVSKPGSSLFNTQTDPIFWDGSQFQRASLERYTDANGHVSIGGLVPGSYRISAPGCPEQTDIMGTPLEFGELPIDAPSTDVHVPRACSMIEVVLDGVDSPPEQVKVTQIQDASNPDQPPFPSTTWLQWSSIKRFSSVPGYIEHLDFDLDGYALASCERTFPPLGEKIVETMHFTPESPASLTVKLTTPVGDPITRAGFGFFHDADAASKYASFAPQWRDSELSNEVFEMTKLRPGHVFVAVHPRGTFNCYFGYKRETVFEVDLTSGAHETREVALELGGRLRAVWPGGGSDSNVTYSILSFSLRDAADQPVSVMACRFHGNSSSSSNALAHGFNEFFPNLVPGDYTLELKPLGKSPVTLHATVLAGKTVDVAIDADIQ